MDVISIELKEIDVKLNLLKEIILDDFKFFCSIVIIIFDTLIHKKQKKMSFNTLNKKT